MNWWIVATAVLALFLCWDIRGRVDERRSALRHANGLRRRIAALEGEVMALEARSRGVGGTGEYRTTGIETVASPGWAAQATPTPRGADAPRPAATDR